MVGERDRTTGTVAVLAQQIVRSPDAYGTRYDMLP